MLINSSIWLWLILVAAVLVKWSKVVWLSGRLLLFRISLTAFIINSNSISFCKLFGDIVTLKYLLLKMTACFNLNDWILLLCLNNTFVTTLVTLATANSLGWGFLANVNIFLIKFIFENIKISNFFPYFL